MLRRVIGWMLWGIKGLLLAICLVALFAWGWSYGHPGNFGGSRWWMEAGRADHREVACGWMGGRIVIGRWWWDWSGVMLAEGRRQAGSPGPGWSWDYLPRTMWWMDPPRDSAWGPFRRDAIDFTRPGLVDGRRILSFPAWLAAVVAGCWPVVSIAMLIRRRRRLWRLGRVGCCAKCGYDLRATPDGSGALLAICPECGTACKTASGLGRAGMPTT